MAISFSEDIMKAWGFERLAPSQSIAAKFQSVHVYKIRGIVFGELAATGRMTGKVGTLDYALSVGTSVNAICRKLVDDDFTDSEEAWQEEHKCKPPYLMVHLGPTATHEALLTHAKVDGQTVETYDSFPHAAAELREIEGIVLPPLLSALACSFSLREQSVQFSPVHRAVLGFTADNRRVRDSSFKFFGEASILTKIDDAEIQNRLASGIKLAATMNSKVARLFHLALDDADSLKKFLYFFQAIEIETHATFGKIDHAKNISSLIAAPGRVAASTYEFFERHRKQWQNLRDRFVWCALCVWTHLGDDDVRAFLELKKIRDNIAHGTIATPPQWAIPEVEKLARRLQLASA